MKLYYIQLAQGSHYLDYLHRMPTIPDPYQHWQLKVFFSDLTRFEFSGLGAPKAVDIPKLISHVVHINSLKHNPDRGFEFTTSTHDNYPTILMDVDDSNYSDSIFKLHNFDVKAEKKTTKDGSL